MSQPSQPPPLSLLRLREADIVRLCGLNAAAQGLDLLTRRSLQQLRREGARLSATIGEADGDAQAQVWAEVTGESPAVELRWGCSLHLPQRESQRPGCAHIAAMLAAWIRAPADFVTPLAAGERPPAPREIVAPPAPSAPSEQPTERGPKQPRLFNAPRTVRPRTPLTLGDELRRLPAHEAVAIARRTLNAELDEAEARSALETALRDAALLRGVVARLDAEAAETLSWLRLAGGALTSTDLDAMAARAGRPSSVLRAALTTLERHGLVFTAVLGAPAGEQPASSAEPRDEPGWMRLKGWRIATETRDALPPALPIPSFERPFTATDAANAGHGSQPRMRVEAGSPRGLLLALTLLARAAAPLGPFPARPDQRDARAADASSRPERRGRAGSALTPEDLSDGQTQELARGVGVEASIVSLARRTLLWARERQEAQAVTDLARTPPTARPHAFRAGFGVWLHARSPADLVDLERRTKRVRLRYDHTREAFRPAALAEEAAEARIAITQLLGQAKPGAWHSVADLLDLVWRVQPYFLRGRQLAFTTPAWRIERISDGRPLRPNIRAEWDTAEGAYIASLLRGPLHWWGVVDLAVDEAGEARSFRVTPLGSFLLGRAGNGTGDNAESERRALAALSFDWGPIATPTRDGALATQPLAAPAALLDLLERWATVSGLAGGRLIYTFAADQACANFDRGLRPEDALAPLRTLGLGRAAQTLAPRLEGWRAGYGDARISMGVTVVEGRDEATLREALASAPALAERARWLSPTLVALGPADAVTLREALARRRWEL